MMKTRSPPVSTFFMQSNEGRDLTEHARLDAKVDMSQIQLKAEDLYDKEKVDLETIVVDDVFKLLQCDENGLTDEEANRRLELFGPNKQIGRAHV